MARKDLGSFSNGDSGFARQPNAARFCNTEQWNHGMGFGAIRRIDRRK